MSENKIYVPIAICCRHSFWLLSFSSLSFCNRNYSCVCVCVASGKKSSFNFWITTTIYILFTTFSVYSLFLPIYSDNETHTGNLVSASFVLLLEKKRTNKYVKYIPQTDTNAYFGEFTVLRAYILLLYQVPFSGGFFHLSQRKKNTAAKPVYFVCLSVHPQIIISCMLFFSSSSSVAFARHALFSIVLFNNRTHARE